MNAEVDQYLIDGCGRCSLYRTPECKVHNWTEELRLLRSIVLESGLQEEFKWKQPCYTYNGGNVLIVTAFKDYACIAFFKGSLLKDDQNMLVQPGENSQAARQLRFTSVGSVADSIEVIKRYIMAAIEIEKQGKKVDFSAKKHLDHPEELQQKMDADGVFKKAFESLTPGRQRGYLLHFSNAKQSETRRSRIEKYESYILAGKGMHDR